MSIPNDKTEDLRVAYHRALKERNLKTMLTFLGKAANQGEIAKGVMPDIRQIQAGLPHKLIRAGVNLRKVKLEYTDRLKSSLHRVMRYLD